MPVLVAVHGWGANGSTLSALVDPLVRAGIAVVLFDAASHGDLLVIDGDHDLRPSLAPHTDELVRFFVTNLHACCASSLNRQSSLGEVFVTAGERRAASVVD